MSTEKQKEDPRKVVIAVVLVAVALYAVYASSTTDRALPPPPGIGTDSAPVFKIRVGGDPGLAFSGNYMVAGSTGSESKSVDGFTPAEYAVSGTLVSVSFQKKDQSGTLAVELLKNGNVVKTSSTSAEFGIVSAASN